MPDNTDNLIAPPDVEFLEPPKAVETIEPEKSDKMIKLNDVTTSLLDDKVDQFVDAILSAPDAQSEEFKSRVTAIHNLGNEEIRSAASVSNRFLDKPMHAIQEGTLSNKSTVSQTLAELRRTVEDLDPSKQGDMFAPKRLFGLIPMGNKVQDYFAKYQSSQDHMNKILESMYRGQDELRKDNATIEQEKVKLWQIMEKLEQYIYLAKKIDYDLENRIIQVNENDAAGTDLVHNSEKTRVVQEEIVFYLRQKIQDFQTQLAVSIQGYLALDMVRKNNLELIKGVDRASTTTVSALRTAVMVSQGLANQKLVLDQIDALNNTTANMIEGTSELLKRQTSEVHRQASNASVSAETLQKAFSNIYTTMDNISEYKLNAVNNMQVTIDSLSVEINKAKSYLDRVKDAQVEQITGDMASLNSAKDELKL